MVKIVDLIPGLFYVPQDKMWSCWILVNSLEVTHDQKRVGFSGLCVRSIFRHRKLVCQVSNVNVNKCLSFSDLNQKLNIKISVLLIYICVFSFPCSYSCLFFLLFLSLSLSYFLLFFLLHPTCYSSPFGSLSWVYIFFIWRLVSLYSVLFIPLQNCIFYQGSEPEAPCIYVQVSLTYMQQLFPSFPSTCWC